MTPLLEGRTVRLERMTLAHLPGLEAVAFDDTNWRYMTTWVKTPEDLRGWVEGALRLEAEGTTLPWVTVLQSTGRVAGATRFADLDRVHKTVELGYTWLAEEYRGTRANTEAKLLQLTYGFEALGLRRVGFKTHHENVPSREALRALGAVEEGTLRNQYVMPDGSARHSVYFSIIAEEWPRVRSRLERRLAAVDQPRRFV